MPLSRGAQHYILLLVPRLLGDMNRLGLPRIVRCSGIPEQEVTSLYFEFVSICRVLPANPGAIPPELWEYLIHCVQLMSALVNAAEQQNLERERKMAVSKFLPRARTAVQHKYEEQRQEGTVEFRLAALVHREESPDRSRELCKEALRLERETRFESCRLLSTDGLGPNQATIVENALDYAYDGIADAPDRFATVDLVIRLLDLLQSVLEAESESGDVAFSQASVERIILALGNVLFSNELGLGGTEDQPMTSAH